MYSDTVSLFNSKFRDLRQVLNFCMWKFVSVNKANLALFAETKFHIQKYDGYENIEIRRRALEAPLGSSTDTNLGHNHTKISNTYAGNLVFSNRIFPGIDWPLIIFNIVFSINVTQETQH